MVEQCPALATLQHDLEETNFQSATTIPIYTSLLATTTNYVNGDGANDCNANASLKLVNSGDEANVKTINCDGASITTIDSTA